MARRVRSRYKKKVNFNAELASDETSIHGIVETLTPDDVHIRTSPDQAFFLLEKEVEVTIKLSSDETLSLFCNATSSHIHNHPEHGLINHVNMKITNPSQRFRELFNQR